MKRTVRDDYERSEYDNVADHTVNTANAEITWAEESVKRVTNVMKPVSDEALEKVRQSKYKDTSHHVMFASVLLPFHGHGTTLLPSTTRRLA
jgi:hypothetical protein